MLARPFWLSQPGCPNCPPEQVLAEALGWMATAVEEFGLAALNIMALIEWTKADLGSANAPGGHC